MAGLTVTGGQEGFPPVRRLTTSQAVHSIRSHSLLMLPGGKSRRPGEPPALDLRVGRERAGGHFESPPCREAGEGGQARSGFEVMDSCRLRSWDAAASDGRWRIYWGRFPSFGSAPSAIRTRRNRCRWGAGSGFLPTPLSSGAWRRAGRRRWPCSLPTTCTPPWPSPPLKPETHLLRKAHGHEPGRMLTP